MPNPTYADVEEAHSRIAPLLGRTPVLTSRQLDDLAGAVLYFKCENLQKTGSFKARGAANAVFCIDDRDAWKGFATQSSGNHGQAIAWAAQLRGAPAHVVMPLNSSEVKKAAVRGYGGAVVDCEPGMAAREAAVAALLADTGADYVHPYNDARVIAGQGTAAKELIEECGSLDALVAPVGGGGLISGTCLSARALAEGAKVYGAEPQMADDAARSLAAGRMLAGPDAPATIADGLRASIRERTWHFIARDVEAVLTVSEDEIVAAMRLIWTRMKIVVEPSSAIALAAVLRNRPLFEGRRVGVILTGGNIDLDRLPW